MYASITQLIRHMAWADEAFLDFLEKTREEVQEARRLMAHIVLAEHIWMSRIHARDTGSLTPWSDVASEECVRMSKRNALEYSALVEETTEGQMEKVIVYKTTKGVEYRSRLGDILVHVALHGSYHRGQMAAALRNQHLAPPSTDFILYCRNLMLEA